MLQNEITAPTPLLREDGQLNAPGWCKRNLYIYNRDKIADSKWRIKEWDFYQICDGQHMVQVNFFDISMASALTVSVQDIRSGKELASAMAIEPLTPNRSIMSHNPEKPFFFHRKMGGSTVIFDVKDTTRRIYFNGKCKGKRLVVDITADKLIDQESLTVAIPFRRADKFFYTTKLNCMPSEGTVRLDGEPIVKFDRETAFTVLDWGRGCWPYSNMWFWGNGSTRLADGKLFGFELTWGFGNDINGTETAIMYDGKTHKIGRVFLEFDPEVDDKWMQPWHFFSEDGRFDMTMVPFYDNQNLMMPLNLVGMKTHQVHGMWSGKAVLDDGTELKIENMYAFCEKVYNKW